MNIIDPNDPMVVNLNGKNIDVGYGLVDSSGRTIKSQKGEGLISNQKRKELEIRQKKDAIINEWVEKVITDYLPKKHTEKVDSFEKAEKMMDRYKISVTVHKTEKVDFACIVQGVNFKCPKLIAQKAWAWKA